MYFESPLERILRESREREQRKSNAFLAALLAQGGSSTQGTATIFNPFLQSILKQQKRRVFVSFHHKNDQAWFDYFTKKFSDQYDVFHDKSIGETKVRSDDPEYINRAIREDYIKGSSITVVLCGQETQKRKYVDWEIYSTLHCEHALLGIVLPSATKSFDGKIIVPSRLHDNIQSNYAHFVSWVDDALEIKKHIEIALKKCEKKGLIYNSREKMGRNLT